jgi:multicomponent Na+:H+ antiporter subunit D
MIAFSSAAQIGYIYMGLGLGTTEGTVAAIFHIVTHALTKPLLFLAADRLEAVSGNSKKFANLTGAAHRNRLAGLAFTAGSLSMIGIPGFMGFMSKLQFATSAMAVPGKLVLTMAALAISTLLNTLYFFRTVMRIYTPALDSPYFGHRVHAKQQRTFVVAAICFMVLNLLFGLQSQPVIDLLTKGLSLFH